MPHLVRLTLPTLLAAHAVLLTGGAIVMLPLVWMILTSIRAPDEVFSAGMSLLPGTFYAAQNYSYALREAPLLRYMPASTSPSPMPSPPPTRRSRSASAPPRPPMTTAISRCCAKPSPTRCPTSSIQATT